MVFLAFYCIEDSLPRKYDFFHIDILDSLHFESPLKFSIKRGAFSPFFGSETIDSQWLLSVYRFESSGDEFQCNLSMLIVKLENVHVV